MSRARHDNFEATLENVRQNTIEDLKKFILRDIQPRSLFRRVELLLDSYLASVYIRGLERKKEDRNYIYRAREFACDVKVTYF